MSSELERGQEVGELSGLRPLFPSPCLWRGWDCVCPDSCGVRWEEAPSGGCWSVEDDGRCYCAGFEAEQYCCKAHLACSLCP